MTPLRVGIVIAAFALLALALVHARAEQTRSAARTLALEDQWIDLRRELWSVQAGLARLRAPGAIHDRTRWLKTDLVAPGFDTSVRRGEQLADRR